MPYVHKVCNALRFPIFVSRFGPTLRVQLKRTFIAQSLTNRPRNILPSSWSLFIHAIEMADSNQWYFAYGSNMLSDVFIKRRKVNPIQQQVAYIKTHTLCFNVMGMPYRDPAMGGIREAMENDLPVYGVAYWLTPEDMRQVIVSEGYLLSIQASWEFQA